MDSVPALEVRGLSRRFGKLHAVQDLDLTVKQGDVYGFLGPNGAGKTTAMRCILGLIRKDAGQVRILGQEDMVAARSKVGAIVETPSFYTWMTGHDNLEQAAILHRLNKEQRDKELARVLERVGLTERASDRAGTYSLGMKQRLGIARALLGHPKVLFLDEPTNGLDPRGMKEVRDLIRSLALHDGITVFISSHLLAEVQAICNRVGIIQKGHLRAEGQVAELLAQAENQQVLEVGGPDLDAIRAVLEGMEGVEVLGSGAAGRIRVKHEGVGASQLNRQLVQADVEVEALVPASRNLEDVFMEVTG